MSYLLDRPAFNALGTRQVQFAEGGILARRFAPEIGPLAGSRDESLESLMGSSGQNAAMESKSSRNQKGACQIEPLGDGDIPAMVELARLTKPGPFESGTPKLGQFWGIKEEGVLVAMAGERMKVPGYSEVSVVCTYPRARGRGFARALSAHVAKLIVERGEIPFLHAYTTNPAAIGLYESLGFRIRSKMNVAVVGRKN